MNIIALPNQYLLRLPQEVLTFPFRGGITVLSVLSMGLAAKEKLFSMLAYTPKATAQTAIGGLPPAMGLPCGLTLLTVSVIAILITVPLSALSMDLTYRKLLSQNV